ncbi:substrate-binding domain-containing protein [Streptomyces sp. NPDC047043]|uniref:substrate-binding domain-containing protein n=1 Tax=Streptomyces sp. NPDC047043 TaxID=3154497 RepID=UPI0033FF97D0
MWLLHPVPAADRRSTTNSRIFVRRTRSVRGGQSGFGGATPRTCLRSGIPVPADISVVGFDDSHLARLAHIDLTTVGQDIARLAGLAVARAVARLEGDETPAGEQVIDPRLVVRGTTAPPR